MIMGGFIRPVRSPDTKPFIAAFDPLTGKREWTYPTGVPNVSPLTFTAWQLTAGGALLLPFALLLEPPLPHLTGANILGFAYLGLIGAALTYILWFRGLSRLEPSVVSPLGFLSPTTAVILGWWVLGQQLSPIQIFGIVVVIGSVWLSQRAQQARPAAQTPSPRGEKVARRVG